MLGFLALPAALVIGVAAAGCDRSSTGSTSSSTSGAADTKATPVVSKQTSSTRASGKAKGATQPVATFMSIGLADAPDQPPVMVKFPPARVRLKKTAEGMQAVLYTDDPPEAASKDYKGNSYVFEMDLAKVTEPAELNRAQYRFHAEPGSAGADRAVETNNGVFLNGWDTHLQPAEVLVAFEGEPPQLMAKVVGTFRVVTADKDGPPRVAMIQAMLPANVESK